MLLRVGDTGIDRLEVKLDKTRVDIIPHGGQIEYTPADLLKKGGDRLFRKVVKGMLPKNRLGAKLLNNMYVYEGTEHKHEAQQPKLIDINSYK